MTMLVLRSKNSKSQPNTFNRQDIPGSESTSRARLGSPPDVLGDDGGEPTSCLLSPSDVRQGVPREEGGAPTSSALCLSPDRTQDIPQEEGGDSSSRAPSVSPPVVAQPPLTRKGKATGIICDKCNVAFGRKQELSRHLEQTKKHGGPTKLCRQCRKLLSRGHTLKAHMPKCKGRRAQ